VIHYISVPRLSGITNAVTPFSKKQWDDLEYLLLGYLASIPVPAKGHQSVHGELDAVSQVACHVYGVASGMPRLLCRGDFQAVSFFAENYRNIGGGENKIPLAVAVQNELSGTDF